MLTLRNWKLGILSNTMSKYTKKIQKTTEKILDKIGLEYEIQLEEDPESIYLNIETNDSSLLIGWHGESLFALDHIIKAVIMNELGYEEKMPKLVIDVCGYKKTQADKIKQMAQNTAQKVIKYKRAEVLRPMSSYERRLVHLALKDMEEIITESMGVDPNRRIVIKVR